VISRFSPSFIGRRRWWSLAIGCAGWLLLSIPSNVTAQQTTESRAANDKVQEILQTFEGRGVMADDSSPTPPAESLRTFQLVPGLDIRLFASEPEISQPLFTCWDSRGRMWVLEYRQYQYPAGLKVVRFDQHLRAVFDKVPEPPPAGTPGLDRVTLLEDTDGDGTMDRKQVVIDGLNIATSMQIGGGGIWVLNPPYLLFYPDADRNDVPDGPPEVHLRGFGLQDTHSVANSLMWGPDGWLYGANGSTTGGTVSSAVTKGISFEGQCIWRYHPPSQVFEIYAEGGGNTFSCEIDSKGRVFSGTNSGNTRGYYFPQGAYFDKNWGKHGPLTNPFAFGYLAAMPSRGDTRRFPQAFAIYEGGQFAESFTGDIIAPNSLHNLVWHSERLRLGSSYETVDNADLLTSTDRWFRPVFCGVGPDGGITIADWYDTRLSHVSPVDDWHKTSGRIYQIRPTGESPNKLPGDLHTLDAGELVQLLGDANRWVRQRAVLELGWRGERGVVDRLVAMVDQEDSLEALWALHLLGEIDPAGATRWLDSEDADIRRWVVRLIGDGTLGWSDPWGESKLQARLVSLAKDEPDAQVRSQLASTAKRLPADWAVGLIGELLQHDQDVSDPHIPMLLWWALEAQFDDWSAVRSLVAQDRFWESPLVRDVILQRLIKRAALDPAPEGLTRAAELVRMAPNQQDQQLLLTGLNAAFQGRRLPELPAELSERLTAFRETLGNSGVVLALRQGATDAAAKAIDALRDGNVDLGVKIELVDTLGQIAVPETVPLLLQLAVGSGGAEPALQRGAIAALARYDDPQIPGRLLAGFANSISAEHELRDTACRTLVSRELWAADLVDHVNNWLLRPDQVPRDVQQRLYAFESPDLRAATIKAFGPPPGKSSEAKEAEMIRYLREIPKDSGDPRAGALLYTKKCAQCHRLYGEGGLVGPELDGYERGNLRFWMLAILDPSVDVREGYQTYRALTDDGRVLAGTVVQRTPDTVRLRTADNTEIILQMDRLESFEAQPQSIMPEDLLKDLTIAEVRDLIAYLSLNARPQR
jgi:putative membrane-bound dehydrogenase-like protein